MAGEMQNAPCEIARLMLQAFASVGAKSFDLTLTTSASEKASFRRSLSAPRLLRELRGLLASAETTHHNIIVRPYSTNAALFSRLAPEIIRRGWLSVILAMRILRAG